MFPIQIVARLTLNIHLSITEISEIFLFLSNYRKSRVNSNLNMLSKSSLIISFISETLGMPCLKTDVVISGIKKADATTHTIHILIHGCIK